MTGAKIGVLTFHRCINYGSYWQARCLVEGLRARGHQTTILDHYSRRINLAEWKCAFQPVLPTPVLPSDFPLYREKIQRFFRAFAGFPLSSSFPIDDTTQIKEYDVVIVGSDEVWNLFHPWYGRHPLFYGEGLRAQRLVSYAASFGNYPAAWGLEQEWANRLQNFAFISVRDENSHAIIKNATGMDPEIVLDPCLQFPVEGEKMQNGHHKKPYVAVYGHNFSGSFISKVKKWATHKKLPLISVGYRNDWADGQWITAGPHEFAYFMAEATAVATNFFHGCVFALRYQKPFTCEASPYRSNKVQGLMQKVGGMKHLITEDTPDTVVHTLLSEPFDTQIIQNIDRLRRASNAYLDQALEFNQLQCA